MCATAQITVYTPSGTANHERTAGGVVSTLFWGVCFGRHVMFYAWRCFGRLSLLALVAGVACFTAGAVAVVGVAVACYLLRAL